VSRWISIHESGAGVLDIEYRGPGVVAPMRVDRFHPYSLQSPPGGWRATLFVRMRAQTTSNIAEFYKKWKKKVIVVWLKFSCDFNKLVEILLQSHYMTILLIRMALFFTLK